MHAVQVSESESVSQTAWALGASIGAVTHLFY
jgi:hypothetical protein